MVQWLQHLYGPSNHFTKCPNCRREFTDDQIRMETGLCVECTDKLAVSDTDRSSEKQATQSE